MRKLLSFVGGLALAGAALTGAQDARADGMARPQPVYIPAVARYNWSGLYFGANLGWFNADIDGSYTTPPPDKHSASQDAGAIGGHFGIQHQFGNLVAGVEVAYSGTGLIGDKWGSSYSVGPDCINLSATANRTCQNRITNVLTIGPRLGWVPTERVMLFVGGGFAYGDVASRTLVTSTGVELSTGADSRGGWFIGGGIEWAVTNSILLGVEYQHVDLGSGTIRVTNPVDWRRNDAEADIVRGRISFKIGRPEVVEPLK